MGITDISEAKKTRAGRAGLQRNRYHQYRWNGGVWCPGATSILKIQDAITGGDSLTNWAARTAAGAALDAMRAGHDSERAYQVGMDAVTAARERGTHVHSGIEAMARGEDHIPTADTHPYWYGWASFLMREKPEIIAIEQMVINLTHRFGGTIDLVCKLRGQIAQVDVKTGSIKDVHALQLAAYSAGEFMGNPDDPKKHPMPEFEAHYVVQLTPEGYELVPLAVGDDEREYFLYLADTYQRLRKWNSREKQEAA
jgi:hypothetical protein